MVLEKNNRKNENWLSTFISLAISAVFIILCSIGWLDWIKPTISYVLDPIYVTSSNGAIQVSEYVGTLANISEFRSEYNQMKVQLAQYEVDIVNYQNLKNENESLKIQLELQNKEYKYVHSSVLNHIKVDYIVINTGLQEGITKGDIVVLGNTFLGIVTECNQYTSIVRLPISKSSFLEAYVISSDDDDRRNILSRAVVNGSSDGIKIENIGMNSGVENGDIVIVNDSKVGDSLVLGNIVGLSEDPATTTRTGYVSPAIDFYDLLNVFVRLKDVD
ncbi:rod shape-determining protein MreC [bacterium]|nr:rod shape-determining protein MreC [bacterium]